MLSTAHLRVPETGMAAAFGPLLPSPFLATLLLSGTTPQRGLTPSRGVELRLEAQSALSATLWMRKIEPLLLLAPCMRYKYITRY